MKSSYITSPVNTSDGIPPSDDVGDAAPRSAGPPRWRAWPWAGPMVALTLCATGMLLFEFGSAAPWLPAHVTAYQVACLMCVACGLLAGFLSGLLGIGGALIVVPALYLLLPAFGIGPERLPHVAVATSLAVMMPSACMAASLQYRRGALTLDWLARLGPGVLAGAALGALMAQHLRGPALSMMFALQSLYYGWGLMRSARVAPQSLRAAIARAACRLPAWFAGPVMAAFCACAGMGVGSLVVPYLLVRGLPLLPSVASASALNIAVSMGGVLSFATSAGDGPGVQRTAATIIGLCAITAVPFGVAMAHRMPVALFRRVLGAVTLIGAMVLIVRSV